MFDLNLSGGSVLDFRVQNLLIFLMVVQIVDPSHWYEMCLIEKTDDSTHRHTCRANQNFTKIFMFRFVLFFFYLKELFFVLSLSQRGRASLIHLRTVCFESNSEQYTQDKDLFDTFPDFSE